MDSSTTENRLKTGAWALAIYPFIALPSVMSLAGHVTGKEPALLTTVARGFQIGSLAYPAVYVVCLIAALLVCKHKEPLAAKIALAPIWYIGGVFILFISWMTVDGIS